MSKILLAALLTFQCAFSAGAAENKKYESRYEINTAVTLANASANVESFMNIVALQTDKAQEMEELKAFLGPKLLKKTPLKWKRVDGTTFSAGKTTVSLKDGSMQFNGKPFQYNPQKTLLENYKQFASDIKPKTKSSRLQLLIPFAFAQFGDYEDGDATPVMGFFILFGGLTAAVLALPASLGGAAVCGVVALVGLFMLASMDTDAADGITPVKSCEKNGDTYKNSFKHINGQTITEEFKSENGFLTVTTKVDGAVQTEQIIAKKGGTYQVTKMTTGGKSVDLDKATANNLGQASINMFKNCSDPLMKKRLDDMVKKFSAKVKSGDIKLADIKSPAVMAPAQGAKGSQ